MTVVIGLFVGWIELICIVVASLVIPPEHIGSGTAFFASFRAITGTIASMTALELVCFIFANILSSKHICGHPN
jgi:hypothetical protein